MRDFGANRYIPLDSRSLNGHRALLEKKIISIENLSVKYKSTKALSKINITIDRGEFLFLIGPSGAGKTSLLKVISQELSPSEGRIIMFPLTREGNKPFCTNVYQDLSLVPEWTCMDNFKVSYDPKIYSSKKSFYDNLSELINVFGLEEKLLLKVSELNGGAKQQVGVIRALLSKPDILLADEPTSSLDLDNVKRLYEVFNFYNMKRGTTIIWATHQQNLISNFNGRIIKLNKGHLVGTGEKCFI